MPTSHCDDHSSIVNRVLIIPLLPTDEFVTYHLLRRSPTVGHISSAVEIQVTFRSNEFSRGLRVFTAFSCLEMHKCKKCVKVHR